MGVGSEARGGDLGWDRSMSLGPLRPGGERDLVPSPAVSGMGVGLEVGRGATGGVSASLPLLPAPAVGRSCRVSPLSSMKL